MTLLKLDMRKIIIALISVLLFTVSAFAQMEKYHVKVNMDDNFESMDGAFALVKVNGKQVKRIAASSNGKLEFDLEFGQDYVVEFHKQFYATKKIDVFLRQVTSEMIDIGCRGNTWHVGMIQKVEGIDYSVLDNAVGKIFFEADEKCFGWDADYSLKVMEEVDRLEEEMEVKKKEMEKALSDAEKAASKGDFSSASASLIAAEKLFPHDKRITQLKEDVDKAAAAAKDAELAEAAAAEAEKKETEEKAKNEEYDKYMSAGDKALKAGEFDEAKTNYTAAGKVKPESTAVKTKLQVVEDTKAKRAAQQEAEKLAKEEESKKEEATLAAAAAAKIAKEAKEAEELATAEAAKAAETAKEQADKEAALKQKEADKLAAAAEKEESEKKKAAEEAEAQKLEAEAQKIEEEAKAAAALLVQKQKENASASKAEAKAAEAKEKEAAELAKAEAEKLEVEKKEKEKEAEALSSQAEKDLKAAEKAKIEEDKIKAEEEKASKEASLKADEDAKQKAAAALVAENKAKEEAKKVKKETNETVKAVKKEEKKQPETKTPATVTVATPVTTSKKTVTNSVKKENEKKKAAMHSTAKKTNKSEDKHADIHAKLDQAAMAQNPKSTSIHEHHDWDMNQPGMRVAIAKEYPEGVTEEIYMKGNKEITERVVVKDGKGDIYWKIKHPWGGVYYFKNTTTNISSVEFDLFTMIKDEDGNIIEPYHIDRVQDHDH